MIQKKFGLKHLSEFHWHDINISIYSIFDLLEFRGMEEILKKRIKNLAIMVWHNCQNTGNEFKDYKNQLIRCSSSVGANYRAACRAKSGRNFINKLKIVEEELNESMFFIELIVLIKPELNSIWKKPLNESEELLKIIVKSIGTVRARIANKSK